jgi:Flp pilus assembly protein TadG
MARSRRRHQGQSLVEFALVLPILMALLLLTIDVGRLFYAYVGVTNASREGAAYAITSATAAADTPTITTYARQELAGNVDKTGYAVSAVCTPSCATSGEVKVNVSTSFSFLFPFLLSIAEAMDPRFVPLTRARARSLADRRVISHYEFLLLNRTQLTAVAEASRAASFAD